MAPASDPLTGFSASPYTGEGILRPRDAAQHHRALVVRFMAVVAGVGLAACTPAEPTPLPIMPGTYDLTIPYMGATSWTAPVPQSTPGPGGLPCSRYIKGWYMVGADGAVESHRFFFDAEVSGHLAEEILTGKVESWPYVRLDYGWWEERVRVAQEGGTQVLYIEQVFRERGTCTETHHTLRYTLRAP